MDAGVWILIAFIWIAIDAFLASEFMDAAEEKGYDDRKYFWFCLLFGLPGWMLVIALPDRPVNLKTAQNGQADSQAAAQASDGKTTNELFEMLDWQFECVYKSTVYKLLTQEQIAKLIADGMIEKQRDYYYPTDKGRRYLDELDKKK